MGDFSSNGCFLKTQEACSYCIRRASFNILSYRTVSVRFSEGKSARALLHLTTQTPLLGHREKSLTTIGQLRCRQRNWAFKLLLLISFRMAPGSPVFSLSALFLWWVLPGCVVPGPALWADSSGSYTTRDLEIILLS